MGKLSFLIFGILIATKLSSAEEQIKTIQCDKVLLDGGVTPYFGDKVGHAIHSLHLRALKKFNPNVTAVNHVPTINLDLSSPYPILPFAPDRTTPDYQNYHTEGSAIIDEILSHLDDENYLSKNYSPLEQVVHGFHMEELWAIALKEYRKFEANPPSEEVCLCAVDVENNGILTKLRQMALYMREPNLMYGDTVEGLKRKDLKEKLVWSSEEEDASSKGYDPDLLLKGSDSLPSLDSLDAWHYYKSTGFHDHNETDAALYLYCILKNAGTEEDAEAYEESPDDDGQPLKYSGWPPGHVKPLKYSGWPAGHVKPLKYSGWPGGHVKPLKYSGWPSGHVKPLKYSGWPGGHVKPLKYSGWPSGHIKPLDASTHEQQ